MVFNAEFDKLFRTGRNHGERVPGARALTIGSLPGGGSGGAPNPNLWPDGGGATPPLAVLGQNSIVVYGSNYQVAVPLNFQMAVGSNLQICVNPSSLQTLVPGSPIPMNEGITGMMGSGVGGNMQLTLGTSANFVIGQSFDINLGPRRIVVDAHDWNPVQTGTKFISWVMIGVILIFIVAYALEPDDDLRAELVGIFGSMMQLFLMNLVMQQKLMNNQDEKQNYIDYRGGYLTEPKKGEVAKETMADEKYPVMTGLVVAAELVGVLVMPPILAGIGESKLVQYPPSSN
jgi:hypothetical protein